MEITNQKQDCNNCHMQKETWAKYLDRKEITPEDLSYCKNCGIEQNDEIKGLHEFYLL